MMERAHGCDCSSVSGLVTPGSQNNLYEVTVITIMSDLGMEALSLSIGEEGDSGPGPSRPVSGEVTFPIIADWMGGFGRMGTTFLSDVSLLLPNLSVYFSFRKPRRPPSCWDGWVLRYVAPPSQDFARPWMYWEGHTFHIGPQQDFL